ncbi:acyltransferase family protein [Enterococcus faecium]|uniref:acyltransferase family protein n=1 Tax=Enterococcus faecium TaxID=1352 RepID=UPI000A33E895|nr:acyltransferase [Enterococcus faecium]OTO50602.1 hypothetical protein A5814_002770 [Enterococcus faecium]
MNRIQYIDGLRGIAVLMVLFFHLNMFEQGFAGVELFFVISGYIITFLLLREKSNTSTINLSQFYLRRVSRLYPSLILLVLITMVLFLNFPIESISEKFTQEALFTSLGITNWYELLHTTGYWASGVKSPLLHMWSIAIEIQFYLFWPLIIKTFLTFDKSKQNRLTTAMFILVAFAFFIGTMVYSYKTDFNTLYYATQTRALSFIVGGIFASIANNSQLNESKNEVHGWLSFLLTIGLIGGTTWFQLNDISLFRGKIFLYTLLCGSLLLVLSQQYRVHFVKQILENPVLLYFGKLSYSLYLWHMPLIIFLTQENIQALTKVTIRNQYVLISIQLICSILIAAVSNRVIEQQLRIRKKAIACLLVLGFPAVVTIFSQPQITQHLKVINIQPAIPEKWQKSDPIVIEGEQPLLIIGDSWARRLSFGLYLAQNEKNIDLYKLLVYGVGNSSIMNPDHFLTNADSTEKIFPFKSFDGYLAYWDEAIRTYSPKKVLIVTGYADQSWMVINGKKMRVGSKEFEQHYLEQFKALIHFFTNIQIEIYITNVSNNAHIVLEKELNIYSDNMNRLFNKAVTLYGSEINVLDLKNLLSNGEHALSPTIIENKFMYDETDHPSYEGSLYIGNWLLENLN